MPLVDQTKQLAVAWHRWWHIGINDINFSNRHEKKIMPTQDSRRTARFIKETDQFAKSINVQCSV